MTNNPLALYLHIPFCAARCAYCDFNTYAGLERLFAPFTGALVAEIRRAGETRGRPPAHTLFIGGGTPTVLPPELLARSLDACREAFDLAPAAEITSEANPGTVDQAHFAALRGMGVNRLSMGVQSFDDAELRWLGRIHSADEAEAAFRAARQAGFANINLDFIFGLPGQEPATWLATLARAIALQPEHLSLYSLTVEHGTPLAGRVQRGLAQPPDDDLAADLYALALDTLAAAGYEQYEISNWARGSGGAGESGSKGAGESGSKGAGESGRKGAGESGRKGAGEQGGNTQAIRRSPAVRKRSADRPQYAIQNQKSKIKNPPLACRHNLVYWRRGPYLGFGPGAHSFDGERRWWNVKPVPEYIRRIEAGLSPERDGEAIDQRLAMGETMMLGLRLVQEGVTDARFRARFGVGLEDAFGAEIAGLSARGLLERLPDRVRLTPQGRLLGNQVFAEFLAA